MLKDLYPIRTDQESGRRLLEDRDQLQFNFMAIVGGMDKVRGTGILTPDTLDRIVGWRAPCRSSAEP